jgi:tetratricopeptide (TPR) repeat protein
MAQVYRKINQPRAYAAFLEEAYTLNPGRSEYSLELGRALSRTNEKKKAIYHLGRYIESKGDVDDPDIYLMIGNINEDIGRYLETVKHYRSYLAKKPEDGYIHFALGYLAYKRIGDYSLAVDSFDKALKYLPEKDILRRSKANEYKGDIFMQELEFEKAAGFYAETLRYQNEIKAQMDGKIREILKIKDDIRSMKSSLIKSQDYDKYNEYERFQEEKGKMELDNREKNYEFGKLNAGKVRWNMAESYERLGRLDEAMKYYREAVALDYQAEQAREKIIKLQLKINRGY